MLDVRWNTMTIVAWINGHAKQKKKESITATAQNLVREWWGRGVDLRRRVFDWAVHIREHNKEADLWGRERCRGL